MNYFSMQPHLLNGENVEKKIYGVHLRLQTQITAESRNATKMSKVGWV